MIEYIVNKNTWIMGKFKKIGEVIEISETNAKHFLSKGFIASKIKHEAELECQRKQNEKHAEKQKNTKDK